MELNLKVEDHAGDSLAPGWYAAIISGESDQVSHAGDNMLKLIFSVENGRQIPAWYNICHPKENVRKIALKELSRLVDACGLAGLIGSAELVGRKCEIKVELDGTYNRVKGYRSAPRSAPPSQSGNGSPQNPWDE